MDFMSWHSMDDSTRDARARSMARERGTTPRGFAFASSSSSSAAASSASSVSGASRRASWMTRSRSATAWETTTARAWFALALALALVVGVLGVLGVTSRARRARRLDRRRARAIPGETRDDARDARRAGRAFADAVATMERARERGASETEMEEAFAEAAESVATHWGERDATSTFARAARRRRAETERARKDGPSVDAAAMVRSNGETVVSRAGARGMSGGNVGNSTVVKTPSPSPSASTATSTMHEEDRALLREQLEVKKLEVGLNYMALMQKQTSNELKAEGNRLAADGAAERRKSKAVDEFHGMTCDALALGLMTTCAVMLTLGWDRVTTRYGQWSTRCARSSGFTSLDVSALVSPFAAYSYAKCVATEGARAVFGVLLILTTALVLTRMHVSRRFRAAPASILAVVLGVGVGGVGERASRALGGDPHLWRLLWRLYLTLTACFTVSAPHFADAFTARAHLKWSYYLGVGVGFPCVVAASAFSASARDLLSTLLALFPSTSPSSSYTYYYV